MASREKIKKIQAVGIGSRLLRGQVSALNDRIRRFKEEIIDEVRMLTAALQEDKQETIGQVRRRISRLKGSLEYRGRSDFTTQER